MTYEEPELDEIDLDPEELEDLEGDEDDFPFDSEEEDEEEGEEETPSLDELEG